MNALHPCYCCRYGDLVLSCNSCDHVSILCLETVDVKELALVRGARLCFCALLAQVRQLRDRNRRFPKKLGYWPPIFSTTFRSRRDLHPHMGQYVGRQLLYTIGVNLWRRSGLAWRSGVERPKPTFPSLSWRPDSSRVRPQQSWQRWRGYLGTEGPSWRRHAKPVMVRGSGPPNPPVWVLAASICMP